MELVFCVSDCCDLGFGCEDEVSMVTKIVVQADMEQVDAHHFYEQRQ